MIAEREAVITRRPQESWILTPNFQKLLLGFVHDRGLASTTTLLEALRKQKEKGNGTFPPYFDLTLGVDLIQVLGQLEEDKLLIHTQDKELGDVWFLTLRGINSITEKRATTPLEQPRVREPIVKVRIQKNVGDTSKEEQTRLRDQARIAREEQRQTQIANTRLRREERKRQKEQERKEHLEEIQRVRNQQKEARKLAIAHERAIKEQKRTERKRQKEQREGKKRLEIARLLIGGETYKVISGRLKVGFSTIARVNAWLTLSGEGFRLVIKRNPKKREKELEAKKRKKPGKHQIKALGVELISQKPDKKLEEEEKQRAEKREKLENAIAKAIKKLRKKRYKAHLPIFRESDGQGVRVYLSPKGQLCYKPRDREYVIDLDVAVDVYDEKKIIRSIKDALALRGIK